MAMTKLRQEPYLPGTQALRGGEKNSLVSTAYTCTELVSIETIERVTSTTGGCERVRHQAYTSTIVQYVLVWPIPPLQHLANRFCPLIQLHGKQLIQLHINQWIVIVGNTPCWSLPNTSTTITTLSCQPGSLSLPHINQSLGMRLTQLCGHVTVANSLVGVARPFLLTCKPQHSTQYALVISWALPHYCANNPTCGMREARTITNLLYTRTSLVMHCNRRQCTCISTVTDRRFCGLQLCTLLQHHI